MDTSTNIHTRKHTHGTARHIAAQYSIHIAACTSAIVRALFLQAFPEHPSKQNGTLEIFFLHHPLHPSNKMECSRILYSHSQRTLKQSGMPKDFYGLSQTLPREMHQDSTAPRAGRLGGHPEALKNQ